MSIVHLPFPSGLHDIALTLASSQCAGSDQTFCQDSLCSTTCDHSYTSFNFYIKDLLGAADVISRHTKKKFSSQRNLKITTKWGRKRVGERHNLLNMNVKITKQCISYVNISNDDCQLVPWLILQLTTTNSIPL